MSDEEILAHSSSIALAHSASVEEAYSASIALAHSASVEEAYSASIALAYSASVEEAYSASIALAHSSSVAKAWRDEELSSSDWIVSTPDHPDRPLYFTYRQKLRDWPTLDTFPSASSKPTI